MRLKMKMGTPHLDRAPQLHKCQRNESPMESQVRKKAKRSETGPSETNRFFHLAQGPPFQEAPLGLQVPLGMGPLSGLPLPLGMLGQRPPHPGLWTLPRQPDLPGLPQPLGMSDLPPHPGLPDHWTLPPQPDLPGLPWILMRDRK